MAGFPTLGAVTPVSGLLVPDPPEQALRLRPAQQQIRTAMPGLTRPGQAQAVRPKALVALTIASFLSLHRQACRTPLENAERPGR
jgi:hypothetical protein